MEENMEIDLTYDVTFKGVFNKRKEALECMVKDILEIKDDN